MRCEKWPNDPVAMDCNVRLKNRDLITQFNDYRSGAGEAMKGANKFASTQSRIFFKNVMNITRVRARIINTTINTTTCCLSTE